MRYEFPLPIGPVVYELGSDGLNMSSRRVSRRIKWHDVIAAGAFVQMHPFHGMAPQLDVAKLEDVVKREHAAAANAGPIAGPAIERFESLMIKAAQTMEVSDRYWLAWRGAFGKKIMYMNVPSNGDDAHRFISELQGYLGPRWRSEPVTDTRTLRREFGISNWWVWPVLLLIVFGGLLAMLLLAAVPAIVYALLRPIIVPAGLVFIFFSTLWWFYKQFKKKS